MEAADAVRGAARKRGFASARYSTPARGFDWSEFQHALASQSLFGGRKIVELRLASGKPGTKGAEAIARYCERPSAELLLLVALPRLDRAGQGSAWFGALARAGVVVDVFPVERTRLPAWIGARLARQAQRAPREVLEFLADRVEGNLLAAHQEVQKLALLAPEGELTLELVRDAVANVARFDVAAASEALLAGEVARYVRIIDGLRGEGGRHLRAVDAVGDCAPSVACSPGWPGGRSVDELLAREPRMGRAAAEPMKSAARRVSAAKLARSLMHAASSTARSRASAAASLGGVHQAWAKLGRGTGA